MFLVIAYRWGWTNNSWYLVYGGPDLTKACALAVSEATSRGGKYGCTVYEFDGDGTGHTLIAHEPSMNGEKAPTHNERINYFERLGHFLEDYATGKALLPDPDNPNLLKYTDVEAPQLVKDQVARQKAILATYEKTLAEAQAAAPKKE